MKNPYGLTKQETRLMSPLCAGKLYKEIAEEFHITLNTVKKHIKSIYPKLEVRNRTEACIKYWQIPPITTD
jgi:DNA-binding NarL/FixJ family response regulator